MTVSSNEGNANVAEAGNDQAIPDTSEDQAQLDSSQAQVATPQAKETQGKGGEEGDHAEN